MPVQVKAEIIPLRLRHPVYFDLNTETMMFVSQVHAKTMSRRAKLFKYFPFNAETMPFSSQVDPMPV
ncbi:hypothetical protein R3P38DRAFT_3201943 [Favolaschia claudopus]|uniref:Uncharacterized protein n=1 Tax=Favolaschia claudopus TaxID=2862362 RepID=A0AAW0AW25_9AGAR